MNRSLVWILGILVVALGVYYFWYRQPQSSTEPTTSPPAATEPAPTADRFELTLTGGANTAGPQTYTTTEGRTVTFVITSDKAGDFHVHGYDLEKELAVGEPIELTFTADTAGRFELEYHPSEGEHVGLGALEVQPR